MSLNCAYCYLGIKHDVSLCQDPDRQKHVLLCQDQKQQKHVLLCQDQKQQKNEVLE